MTRTINQEHQKQVIEIMSYIFAEKDFINSLNIMEKYSNDSKSPEKADKTLRRFTNTLNEILGEEVIESKPNLGYRLKPKYRENFFWMLPLFSRYLAITEQESLNYIFEPIVFKLESNSLNNLFLLQIGLSQRLTIEFEYTNYEKNHSKLRKMQIYSIVQRDKKLLVMGKDLNDNKNKHFFFTEIKNIKILEETFEKPDRQIVKDYYKECIGIYKSNKKIKVKIQFSKEAEYFMHKEYFHKDQKITPNSGGFLLELHATKKEEIFNIVTQFMKYAELLEPTEWRIDLHDLLEKILAKHKKNPITDSH